MPDMAILSHQRWIMPFPPLYQRGLGGGISNLFSWESAIMASSPLNYEYQDLVDTTHPPTSFRKLAVSASSKASLEEQMASGKNSPRIICEVDSLFRVSPSMNTFQLVNRKAELECVSLN
jgi:hypothetical protein